MELTVTYVPVVGLVSCDQCKGNFVPPAQCNSCAHGWTGGNCDSCATNFGPPELWNTCVTGRTGPNCDTCDTNFGPTGQCNRCNLGYVGANCDTCHTNQHYTGHYIEHNYGLTATLQFSGNDCILFTGQHTSLFPVIWLIILK